MTINEFLNVAIKAIEDEPEFPGEMPEEMYQTLIKLDKDGMTYAYRLAVQQTKERILNRLKEAVVLEQLN